MRVSIKSFDVAMEIEKKGIELEVRDNEGGHLGDLFLTRKGLIWCHGRTQRKNGVPMSWANFIAFMEAD